MDCIGYNYILREKMKEIGSTVLACNYYVSYWLAEKLMTFISPRHEKMELNKMYE